MMRLFSLLCAALILLSVGGCSSGGQVSQEDARNFSKTPDGKDTGIDEVNNNR